MTVWFRRRLGAPEVVGYLIFVGGLMIFAARGTFSDYWVMTGTLLIAVGAGMSARTFGLAERAPSNPSTP